MDKITDYIPIISSISNLNDLFIKYFDKPSKAEINKDVYYKYIIEKSTYRCVTLLIPILGNLIICLLDIITLCKKGNLNKTKNKENETPQNPDIVPASSKDNDSEPYALIYDDSEDPTSKIVSHEKIMAAKVINDRAIKVEDPKVLYDFALKYFFGNGIPKSIPIAILLLKAASDMKYNLATLKLSLFFESGLEIEDNKVIVKKNVPLAWAMLRKLADEYLMAEAQYEIGLRFEEGKKVFETNDTTEVTAFNYFTLAAEQGNLNAKYRQAFFYLIHRKSDEDIFSNKAFKIFSELEKEKHPNATYNLAICLKNGIGTDKKPEEALAKFQEANLLGVEKAKAEYDFLKQNIKIKKEIELQDQIWQQIHEDNQVEMVSEADAEEVSQDLEIQLTEQEQELKSIAISLEEQSRRLYYPQSMFVL